MIFCDLLLEGFEENGDWACGVGDLAWIGLELLFANKMLEVIISSIFFTIYKPVELREMYNYALWWDRWYGVIRFKVLNNNRGNKYVKQE